MNVIERIAVWHEKLSKEAEYRQYVTAMDDEASVEGTIAIDTAMAAFILRKVAVGHGDGQMLAVPLDTILRELARLIGRNIDWEELSRENQIERSMWRMARNLQRSKPN